MSSSESEEDVPFESIIATRQRRSNAGSRLRQLLQLEELEEDQRNDKPITEDDENVNLLFQEDADDGEFVEESEEEEEGEEDEGEDEEGEGDRDQQDNDDDVNPDEMLSSESEDDDADEDEDEGERELQKQERAKRKAKQKKAREIAPIIKKPTTPKKKPQKAKRNVNDAQSLLSETRRSSTRTAAVENKLATAQRLQESEKRRANFKPVERVEEVEMSLEERLAEAVETEKKNILSLTQFYEQEGEKKERQRALAAAKKMKMTEYMRFYSHGAYITPLDEMEERERKRQLEIAREKKSRRYKKKKVEPVKEEPKPEVKEEKPEARLETEPQQKKPEELNETLSTAESQNETKTVLEQTLPEETNAAVKSDETTPENKSEEPSETKTDESMTEATDLAKPAKATEPADSTEPAEPTKPTEPTEAADVEMQDAPPITAEVTEEPLPKRTPKKVKFADEEEEEPKEQLTKELKEEHKEKTKGEAEEEEEVTSREQSLEPVEPETPQYEGPPQFVAVSHIMFEQFVKDPSKDEMREMLFGSQANLPATRRTNAVEPVVRIAKQKEHAQTLFTPYDKLYAREFDYILNQMPKFGEVFKVEEVVENVVEEEAKEVVLRTPAPVGMYLPNGKKKTCSITGKPAQYYDPQSGIPYSSVEAFRTLKNLQDGKYRWLQVERDDDKIKGGIGFFSHLWEAPKHADGVPDWF